jgi:hypothetical protein
MISRARHHPPQWVGLGQSPTPVGLCLARYSIDFELMKLPGCAIEKSGTMRLAVTAGF